MADSIPSLKRKLNKALERILELESKPTRVIEKVIEIEKEVVKEVEGPVRFVEIIREVEIPVYHTKVRTLEVERVVYHDNPEHIESIRKLQDRISTMSLSSNESIIDDSGSRS